MFLFQKEATVKEFFYGKKALGILVCLVAVLTTVAALANPTVIPTGTTLYNPQKSYNMYVLFGAPDGKSHLIDMNGNEVRRWEKSGFPTEMLDPAIMDGNKGHILVQLENGPSPYGGMFNNKSVGELDWNGKTVWRWDGEGGGGMAKQNHDLCRLPNGNTLLVTTKKHIVPGVSDKPITDQSIVEVTPDGKIVWIWNAGDHIDEFGISAEGREQLRKMYATVVPPGAGGFLTINDMQPIGPNKWFDSGDLRFDPENIVIDSREASFIAIIEKKTGKIVWRLGPDYPIPTVEIGGTAVVIDMNRPVPKTDLPRPIDQTSGQHDAHIIPKGLPGSGNLLVFDNESPSGYPPTRLFSILGSRVLEIDPITKQIVWQYTALDSGAPSWDFFSSFISSARRLPNGNTLICEGMNGRIFQVTSKGEIVWEYINPYFGQQFMIHPKHSVKTNWVFRAQPVPYDWVPDETPRSEKPVRRLDNSSFRVPSSQ